MLDLLTSESLARDINEEIVADDTRSRSCLKKWLRNLDTQIRALEPIEDARYRYATRAAVVRWFATMQRVFDWIHIGNFGEAMVFASRCIRVW